MAYGLGFALIDGVLGAAAGAGQGVADQSMLEQKQQIEMLRDQRLSQLRQQEHAADTQSDIAARQANIDQQAAKSAQFFKSNTLPSTPITDQATATYDDPNNPGQTASVDSNPVTTQEAPTDRAQAAEYARKALATGNPNIIGAAEGYQKSVLGAQDMDRKNALEQSRVDLEAQRNGYYVGLARKMNAEADVLAQGGKAIPGPMVTAKQADDGSTYLLDTHSGATGVLIPGQAAVKAETHWVGADTPGKDAVPMHVQWFSPDGKPLGQGLDDLYPAMASKRAAGGKPRGIINAATDDGPQITSDIASQADADGIGGTAATPATAASPAATTAPRQGAIVNGYRFKGGDPHNKSSWEKV